MACPQTRVLRAEAAGGGEAAAPLGVGEHATAELLEALITPRQRGHGQPSNLKKLSVVGVPTAREGGLAPRGALSTSLLNRKP